MSQGRATPYHLGTNTLAIPASKRLEPCTTLCCVSSSEPSTSSRWNAGGSRGRMEALMGQVLHTFRSFPPEERMTVVREGNENRNAGVGNGRVDGPLSSRRNGAECS